MKGSISIPDDKSYNFEFDAEKQIINFEGRDSGSEKKWVKNKWMIHDSYDVTCSKESSDRSKWQISYAGDTFKFRNLWCKKSLSYNYRLKGLSGKTDILLSSDPKGNFN